MKLEEGKTYKLNDNEDTQYLVIELSQDRAILKRLNVDDDITPYVVAHQPELNDNGNITWDNGDYLAELMPAVNIFSDNELKHKDNSNFLFENAIMAISSLTGISVSQIQNLPIDVQDELLHTYSHNALSDNSHLQQILLDIYNLTPDDKNNYLENAEMGMEQNYNQIDGIINNEVVQDDKPTKKPSILEKLKAASPPIKDENNNGIDDELEVNM